MLNPIVWLIYQSLNLLFWLVIIQAALSWLVGLGIINMSNLTVRQIVYGLNQMVDPLLRPIRRVIPNFGGLDISPIFLLLGIQFLQYVVLWANARFWT